jgi:hypothetical protein
VSQIPREARDGIMRAWLEILRERHPGTTWIAGGEGAAKDDSPMNVRRETTGTPSAG